MPAGQPSIPPPKSNSVSVKQVTTQSDLLQALNLRKRVFIEELGISAAEEIDNFDCFPIPVGITHFLVSIDSQPIATCRVNCATSSGAKLERMCVEKVARRKGVGLALLRHIEKSKVVEETRGPFFCYAMKDKELFYRNSGWVVEDGHGNLQEAGIPHVAMIRRRRPQGSLPGSLSLSHVMVRSMDISSARRFYSLLGFQDVSRFKTNGLKAVWLQSPYIDQRIELIEVKALAHGDQTRSQFEAISPGLGHISIDLTRACSDLTKFLLSMQKESLERFSKRLRLLEKPRQIMLGSTVAEVAFMTDADGTVIELMRFIKRLEDRLHFDAEW